MSRLSHTDRTRMNLLPVFATVLAFLLIVVAPAMAQLTQADIEKMRERGKQEGWTFEVGLCKTNSSYPLEQVCGLVVPKDSEITGKVAPATLFATLADFPASWDWRELDGVSPVKDQMNCGACYAFAAVSAFECAMRIRDGVTYDLSEQWLVSCNDRGYDCEGGFLDVHDHHLDRGDLCGQSGAVWESHFPYFHSDAPCECPYAHYFWIDDWAYIEGAKKVAADDDIKAALMEYGPISTAIYVNDSWYGYSGGVFNDCENLQPNHAVTIVGWDDDYLGQSVWIIKNSWDTDWGDEGYMYIPFGCCNVGYAASYVDVGLSGVYFWADAVIGDIPLEVNFDAMTGFTISSWTWDFGDGDSAFVQTPPPHIYAETGTYDVTLEVDAGPDGIRTFTKEMYIVAKADTLRGNTVASLPDSQVEMVINANNSAPVQYIKIPVEYDNSIGVTYDSFSTVGCRTDYFEIQTDLHYDPWYKRFTLKLVSSFYETSPDLEVGEGPLVKLYFTIPGSATLGESATIVLDGYETATETYLPFYYGPAADYEIGFVNGQVVVGEGGCCMVSGDADHDGSCDLADADYFIAWLFQGGPIFPCEDEADMDGNGGLDLADIEYLIDYLFQSGPDPIACD